jgi:hypothetical protein
MTEGIGQKVAGVPQATGRSQTGCERINRNVTTTPKIMKNILWLCGLLIAVWPSTGVGLDLLERYPTKLVAGDARGDHARPWQISGADLYQLSKFNFEVGKHLQVHVGSADLGIGHCADGAVWAVIIPRKEGSISSAQNNQPEAIAHVWLRFHPKQVNRLFPSETVSLGGKSNLVQQVRSIANAKIRSSWQSNGRAMIPQPKDMTVDVDTTGGVRRFFSVDTQAGTADYVDAFEKRTVK